MLRRCVVRHGFAFWCAACLTASPDAHSQIEEVIVTAQKREESVQDVPIAVTAFDASVLEAKQIGTFGDFRFAVPNVSFTKGNFTGNNFAIRGIGTSVVAAGSDSGVEANVNEVPILFPRLFETEFFDVQQIAVLRGPQGTLFGRNSTGGAINMITNVADPGEFAASFAGEIGNFAHRQAQAMVNIPLGETLAVRLAGISLNRDGYTENVAPGGDDIDDRDQYAVRGSIRWMPTESDTFDLMVSYFEEDSSRTRAQKQLCHNDPSAVYGCLPDRLGFDNANALAQLTGLLPGRLSILGPTPGLSNNPAGNPDDLRKVAQDFTPIYEADETLLTLRYSREFEQYTVTAVAGYQDTSVYSRTDFTMSLGQPSSPSALLPVFTPVAYRNFFTGGCLPISAPASSGTGIIGGNIDSCISTQDAYDQSDQETDQKSFELRVQSDYDGRFNFMAGGFHMEADTFNEYWVLGSGLDYFAAVYPEIPTGLGGLGLPGYALASPNYLNRTNNYGLESRALFGEIYLQLRDDLKLTVGARYNDDTKDIDDVQCLLCTVLPVGTNTGDYLTPFTRIDSQDWQETTGRVVLDWSPELDLTDTTLVYASYSRGYKGGGFNPPIDYTLPINAGIAQTFDPEFIDAWELGTKNTLMEGRLQVNLSAFYYDYQGLQVSKIVNRTSLNENADAEIYGAESEILFVPDDHWQLNLNLSYLHSEVLDFESIDTRDPAAGSNGSGVTLLKDNITASNCLLHWNGNTAPDMNLINSCSAPVDRSGRSLINAGYSVDSGIARDLSGNRLQNAPEWQFSAGAQYTFKLLDGYELSARLDYYWQDQMYGRIFNQPIDEIDSWDIWNAQATLLSRDRNWHLRAFVKNIADEDNVVGMYVSDPSSGLFTNVFLIEPRTYGLAFGYDF